MKLPWLSNPSADTTYRERSLTVEVLSDAFVLTAFVALAYLRPHAHPIGAKLTVAFLPLSYIVPIIYDAFQVHSADFAQTDERDKIIEARGLRGGYALMTTGLYFLILYADLEQPSTHLIPILFLIWILTRLLSNTIQLRLYTGHEAWWPDFLVERLNRRRQRRIDALLNRNPGSKLRP
jgi:hypothetical protein